ncbi:MAG: Lrp/AsnC family transcriptional regulator [Candidatus Nanopelagicales bacterium]
MTLDDTNRAIIQLLQVDGRRAYADIAKEVGLSEAAVRQRVRRMLDTSVIQIVAVTDQIQMGYPRAAMIAINVDGDVQVAAEKIAQIDEVDYLVSTAGGIDLLAEVFATHDEHLFDSAQPHPRDRGRPARADLYVLQDSQANLPMGHT